MDVLLARFGERVSALNDALSLTGVETIPDYAAFMDGVYTDIYALDRMMKDLRATVRQQKEAATRMLEH